MTEGVGDLNEALAAWRALLGPAFVLTGHAAARYGECTMARPRAIAAVLRPQSEAEIVEIVRIAARRQVPLYPISTGHNWGYGSANPVHDHSVIVDLSRLSEIVAFDEALGMATLQPGVTQQALSDFLESRGLPFMVPVTGAGPTCSLVGNALERGYGVTPHADHFAAVLGLRAVLPSGEIYQSALSELLGSAIGRLHKWGVGPYLDGLFSQGGFGIVTEMTIALARRPEKTGVLLFEIDDPSKLSEIVAVVRGLVQSLPGHIGGINLLNRLRVLSMVEAFPADRVAAGEAIPDETIEAMGRRRKIPAWLGFGALYAPRRLWRGLCREIKGRLSPYCRRVTMIGGDRIPLLRRAATLLPGEFGRGVRGRLETLAEAHDLVAGRPRETSLGLAYWRSGTPPEQGSRNPARDGCGLVWYAPLVPMTGDAVRRYVTMVETTCSKFGIDPLITLTTLSERCFDSTVALLFDRASGRDRAMACYETLWTEGRHLGLLPYRLNVDKMDLLTQSGCEGFFMLAGKLKEAVDPNDIMSPGRYAASPGNRATERRDSLHASGGEGSISAAV